MSTPALLSPTLTAEISESHNRPDPTLPANEGAEESVIWIDGLNQKRNLRDDSANDRCRWQAPGNAVG